MSANAQRLTLSTDTRAEAMVTATEDEMVNKCLVCPAEAAGGSLSLV